MTNGTVPVGPAPDAAQRVKVPGIALMVIGGIGMFFGLLNLVLNILGVALPIVGGRTGGDVGVGTAMLGGGIVIVMNLVGIVLNGIVLVGGLKMTKLESYGLALAAAIIEIIPCLSACCVVGIPFGIWALIVLLKPEIKAAFK